MTNIPEKLKGNEFAYTTYNAGINPITYTIIFK